MAVDATGTPTSPDSIPTYATSADAPSGKGFNAAMASIQTALSARVGSPAGIASGEVPVWNGSTWVRSSATPVAGNSVLPARVATTVAGLGTAADGALGLLRVGTTPFDFLHLIYDATYAKWVAAPWTLIAPSQSTQGRIVSTVALANVATAAVPNYKAFYDAGMRFQSRMTGLIFKTASDDVRAYWGGSNTSDFNAGDTASGTFTDWANFYHDTSANTVIYVDSGWLNDPHVPIKANHFLQLRIDNATAARSSEFGGTVLGRWVSA